MSVAILPIYIYGQPVLRKRAKPVRTVDEELKTFVESMFETMHHANGVGLAANQVGSLERVIVVDVSDVAEKKHEGVGEAAGSIPRNNLPEQMKKFALINPEVLSSSGSVKMEEGCLSIPEIRDEVERAEIIRVRYKDVEMNTQEIEASGLLARVILHEIDHLNGILFIDKLGVMKRKLLRGRLNKIEKGHFEAHYPTVSAQDAVVQEK